MLDVMEGRRGTTCEVRGGRGERGGGCAAHTDKERRKSNTSTTSTSSLVVLHPLLCLIII